MRANALANEEVWLREALRESVVTLGERKIGTEDRR